MNRFALTLTLTVSFACSALAQHTQTGGNALANASSRYLREASASHIAWRSWNNATLDYAKRGDRPLFVSVGYASSYEAFRLHRFAFTNPTIAETLNGYFVPVLIDRFEHPELAEAFDTIQRAMSGAVTVPSSFVLTPALGPFAVTGPIEPRDLGVLLATSASRWANQKEQAVAEGRANLLKAHGMGEKRAPGEVDRTTLDAVVENIARSFDPANPQPGEITFALHHENKSVRAAALDALRTFARGPRRDLVGGGFHRGATQLEKLLTDQALYALVYLHAWQLTRDPLFEDVVRTTLDYAVRDLHDGKTAFDVAQDAYSLIPGQGPEFASPAFYLWSKDELIRLLGRDGAAKVFRAYRFEQPEGNMPVFVEPLDPALHRTMLEYQQKRPEPFRDFSSMTGANALMISALARAGAVLSEPRYRDAALRAARAVTAKLWNDKTKTLHRSDAAKGPVVAALGEDYALLVQGLLDLFEATYDVRWLALAQTLQQRQDQLFWNAGTGRYSTGGTLPETLRGLLVESDETTPSVNAVAAMNLLRLATLTGNETWRARPQVIFQSFGGRLRADGAQLPQLAAALAASFATPKIVVVVQGPKSKETQELLAATHQQWEPVRAVLYLPAKGPDRARVIAALPFTAALAPDPERPLAYVCEKGECRRQ